MKELLSKKITKVFVCFLLGIIILSGGIYGFLKHKEDEEYKKEKKEFALHLKKQKHEQEYKLALTQTVEVINSSYTNTKPMADLIVNIWHDVCFGKVLQVELALKYKVSGKNVNAVFDKMGQAIPYIPQGRLDLILPVVFAYETDNDTLHKIELSTGSAKSQLDKLKNPPKKYKDMYDKTMTYYTDMNSYVELVKQPQGTYEQYTSKMTDLSTKLQSEYSQLKMQLQ